jgi:hypothetical protein
MIPETEQTRAAALEAVAAIDTFEEKPAPEEKDPGDPEVEAPATCPRCAYDMNQGTPTPDAEDVQEYVRCLMSGNVFAKTYYLFDGQVEATFELLTSAQSDLLSKALSALERDDFMQQASEAMRLKLMFYMRRFGKDTFECPEVSDLETLWEQYRARYDSQGEDRPVLQMRIMMQFLNLTEALPAAGLDETFYKGAGLS